MKRIKIFMAAALTVVAIGGAVAAKVSFAPGDYFVKPASTYIAIPAQACTVQGTGCTYLYNGQAQQVYKDFSTTATPNILPLRN
jgi:hypothetical protein